MAHPILALLTAGGAGGDARSAELFVDARDLARDLCVRYVYTWQVMDAHVCVCVSRDRIPHRLGPR